MKETDNKFRWGVDVDGTKFSLYIPKARVPSPPPQQLRVRVASSCAEQDSAFEDADLKAVVARVSDHTRTVRYRPIGDPEGSQIGEPYIPYEVLEAVSPPTAPEQLVITVSGIYGRHRTVD